MDNGFSPRQLEQLQTAISAGIQAERSYTRQIIREEVKEQLKPLDVKIDRIMATTVEDADALATDTEKLSVRVDDHEERLSKLEATAA